MDRKNVNEKQLLQEVNSQSVSLSDMSAKTEIHKTGVEKTTNRTTRRLVLVWNYFAGFSYRVLDLQSEEEVRCCLSGTKFSFDEKWSHGSAVCETVLLFCGVCMCIPHGNAYL